jgi:hypothetical protein
MAEANKPLSHEDDPKTSTTIINDFDSTETQDVAKQD